MNSCILCGKLTPNPKYCSRSCSVTTNNRGNTRHGVPSTPRVCDYCGEVFIRNNGKYCNNKCSSGAISKRTLEEFLEGSMKTLSPSVAIYNYILEQQSGVCQICSIPAIWNDKPLKFIRDHIDGNSGNNHPDNIRLICHNCDSQLDTYKSKNRGNGRHSRRQRYAEGKSY